MSKALLIAAIGMGVLGQTGQGVITSTDLMAPDISASQREQEAPLPRQEVPAPAAEREDAQDRPAEERREQPEKTDRAPAAEPSPPRRHVTSEEARSHKAVAAFWFILPES